MQKNLLTPKTALTIALLSTAAIAANPRPAAAEIFCIPDTYAYIASICCPKPCKVWDFFEEPESAKDAIQSARSMANSLQQMIQTGQQLMNQKQIMQQFRLPNFTINTGFAQYGNPGFGILESSLTANALTSNFYNAFSGWTLPAFSVGNITAPDMNTAIRLGTQAAAFGIGYAAMQQKFSEDKDQNELNALANAISTSSSIEQDWLANAAIKISIIQKLQERNILVGRIITVDATKFGIPTQTNLTKDTSNPFTTRSN